jgi:hypothetical protein
VLGAPLTVIGGYFDDEFQEATRELWRLMEAGMYRFVTSTITAEELAQAPVHVRDLWADTFTPEMILDVTDEMDQLAAAYMAQAILTPEYTDDARHVAACTLARAEHLVSWNFKHMVNADRKKGFNAVNVLQVYPTVSIINLLELIYDDAD